MAHSSWIFGNFLCKLLYRAFRRHQCTGVFLLACISVDRYFCHRESPQQPVLHHLLVRRWCVAWCGWWRGSVLARGHSEESIQASDLGQAIALKTWPGRQAPLGALACVSRHMGYFCRWR
ncbi:C-X-C chemokine receptor type 1-like isoform X1 [Lates japonicus]|uniref:C-X-C chemokine receptor type 1-like isoform X1 n=1 Tax=Lates japonicus TaxID=270547 RepID=A0AAD3NGC7_LATJO|nr:C-X-C chemokine receptor type 1-like isoform X1 [Lates japonicus]